MRPMQGRCAGSHLTTAVKGIRLEKIQPGHPEQNAYVERFNRTVRYDLLGQELFDSIERVQ